MSKFYADTELEGAKTLCAALEELAESDAPLVFELILADEDEIKSLNAAYRGVDRVTDVLSFPSMEAIKGEPILSKEHKEEIDEEGRLYLGSIVVCTKRAREQAEEYGHSYERELFYLTVHGVLHCLGYDHETEEEKREMREKEETVMRKLGLTRDI